MRRPVVLSGCSGGGKTTLLEALSRRGYATVTEPGRRIINLVTEPTDHRLPWNDPVSFAEAAVAMALEDLENLPPAKGPVFVDRGLVDAVLGYAHASDKTDLNHLLDDHRYHDQVFLTPPWKEHFHPDDDRRHDFPAAAAEYQRLLAGYEALGYRVAILPKIPVSARCDFVLDRLQQSG